MSKGGHRLQELVPLALGAFALASRDTRAASSTADGQCGPIDGGDYAALKQGVREWARKDPIDALVATVVGGGLAFYAAEHKTNPNCQHEWDAILYVATCLSVGYDNCFPTTTAGHAIASVVQTFGPQLANMAFDAPAAEQDAAAAEQAALQRAILARLEDIQRLLEQTVTRVG